MHRIGTPAASAVGSATAGARVHRRHGWKVG